MLMNWLIFFVGFLISWNQAWAMGIHCPSNQYAVDGHHRRSYVRSDGVFVKASIVKPYCKQLTRGYEYSKERFKKNIPNAWPHRHEKASSWKEDEKERVIEVLDEMPDIFLDNKILGIYRLEKSKDYPNPATSADGVIVLYDSAFDSSRSLGKIVSHELSHHNYWHLSEKDRQDYRRASGWQMELEADGKIYWVGRKDGYVEDDGKNSPEEDYANNLEHYLYNSDNLNKVTPSSYRWIRDHFGDDFKLKKGKK
jgi:hypothetical protein